MRIAAIVFLAISTMHAADQKPTPIARVKAAVKANLKTKQGEAFDELTGKEFGEKHATDFDTCVQKTPVEDGLKPFTVYVRLAKDGVVQEVLADQKSFIAGCVKKFLIHDKFSAPPSGFLLDKLRIPLQECRRRETCREITLHCTVSPITF